LFGVLAGLNRCYFTTFQFKRVQRFADQLAIAPSDLVDRLEALLVTPSPDALASLFVLDGEVLALLAARAPQIDLTAARERRNKFSLTQTTR